jgi:hypothetical protein
MLIKVDAKPHYRFETTTWFSLQNCLGTAEGFQAVIGIRGVLPGSTKKN